MFRTKSIRGTTYPIGVPCLSDRYSVAQRGLGASVVLKTSAHPFPLKARFLEIPEKVESTKTKSLQIIGVPSRTALRIAESRLTGYQKGSPARVGKNVVVKDFDQS